MLMMNIIEGEEQIKLKNLKQPILAGFGNPLLDICVNLKDDSFYTKFNIERDGQAEINSSDLTKLIDYVKAENYDLKYCIGGSAQNTLRVFQWIIKYPQFSVFYGAVGDDENGKLLEKEVNDAGVSSRYKKHANHSTGTCIAFINGQDRYLVAHLGAANIYSLSDFDQGQNLDIFNSLHLCYIEGFFISHSFTTALEIIKLCKLNGIVVAFNLSGVYLFKDYYKEILYMVKVSDIVIGNKMEYEEFWKFYGGSNRTLKEILLRVHFNIVSLRESGSSGEKTPKLPYFERNKVVICTNGPNSVLCVHRFNNCMEVKPKMIEHSLIKDTTGAGDAFAAGFFAGILKGFPLNNCIELGCQIAGEIIKTIGCTLPKTNNIIHLE